MLFNTPDFIIFFIFIVTVIVILKDRKFQHLFLLGASFFFFYFSSNYLITLLIFSIILDYQVGKRIYETNNVTRKKILLTISLIGNLGLLGFFKYADFVAEEINYFGTMFGIEANIPFLNLALPIGISFYTFQTISYTVDIYRGQLKPAKNLSEFALFVSFFPQLVAGPIVRAKNFLPQLRESVQNNVKSRLRLIQIQTTNLKLGITIMALGFLKKMFFADNIAPMVDEIFSNPIGLESFTIILGAIAFGIQIYGDFSGYSDIAIGAAMILGFKIPINFNRPYFASSPSDFWRRWHISLSSWLRDYLYIPLGGNKKSPHRTYLNLAIVMFLGGLWHGAAINFILWGLLHGAYLAVHRIIRNSFSGIGINRFFKTKLGMVVSILITQYFVFLAWIPFRVKDTDAMLYSMYKYLVFDFATAGTLEFMSSQKFPIILMVVFFIINYISYKKIDYREKIAFSKLRYWCLFLISIFLLILFFFNGDPEAFIYFQF